MSNLHPLDDYHSVSKRNARKGVRKFLTRPVIKTLLNTTVAGEENVEGLDGAYIVVGNHSSHLDAPMVFTLLPDSMTDRLATGAAADYFYRKPTVSKLTSLFFNTYPIERKSRPGDPNAGRAKGMTSRLLRDGIPILIFPEGTRSRTGELGEFKTGAAALAIKFDIPIVPLAMTGGHEAMPVGSVLPPPNRPSVALYIGSPMLPMEDEDPETFMDRVRDQIVAMLDQESANPVFEEPAHHDRETYVKWGDPADVPVSGNTGTFDSADALGLIDRPGTSEKPSSDVSRDEEEHNQSADG